ncbi:DUF418 domain-containing protein [Actinopolymorpha pittospori]|uniref:DUF418 domain-containing protein n=1 Tax=Actinopolymorpha pittospori TaxID=648752 RepID=A0A927MQD7_9ACTN|nr:DUF418 domain-containing protein [Actinopolymorpha pittospori]MBE1603308.1 uncharacterized protein [Actinopolymorpha pittospori]
MTTTSDREPGVRTGRRIGEVDAVRSFALFGILIANVVAAVTGIRSMQGGTFDFTFTFDTPVDQAVSAVVDAVFVNKFFVLFSFLFGYSFTLQLDAAARVQAPAVPRLLRRSAALFAIGAVHAALLWFGDILTLYAALGLLLVALRTLTPRTAVITAGCVLLSVAAVQLQMTSGGGNAEPPFDVQALDGYRGGPLDTLNAQLTIAPFFVMIIWLTQGPPALAMFLLGLAAGKRRLLEDVPALARWLPRIQWTGFLVGGPAAIWSALAAEGSQSPPGYVGALTTFTNPLLTAAYVATLLRLTRGRGGARLLAALAPAGRMAASNYIAQSLIFVLIYTGYGLALVDRMPLLGVVAIAVATYLTQLVASKWWLQRHPYGPVEWLLRSATNARFPS